MSKVLRINLKNTDFQNLQINNLKDISSHFLY